MHTHATHMHTHAHNALLKTIVLLWLELEQAPTAEVRVVLEVPSKVDEGMCN